MTKKVNYFEARRISPEVYSEFSLPRYIITRLPEDKNSTILDFGCGYGQIVSAIHALGYNNVIGADIEQDAIDFLKKQGYKVENVSDLDLFVKKRANFFDMIIMSHVLEHLPKDYIIPFLEKIKLLLKKEGILFVMVPNAQSNTGAYWAYEDFTHHALFTSGSIYYVLKWQDMTI